MDSTQVDISSSSPLNLPPSTRIHFAGVQDVGIPSDLPNPMPALTRGVNELLVKDFSIQGGRQVQLSFYNTINNKYKLIIILDIISGWNRMSRSLYK